MKNPRGEEKEGRSETFNIADRLIFSSRERRTAAERACGKAAEREGTGYQRSSLRI